MDSIYLLYGKPALEEIIEQQIKANIAYQSISFFNIFVERIKTNPKI